MPMTYEGKVIKPISRQDELVYVELPDGTRQHVSIDSIQIEADIEVIGKTPGQLAYEEDCRQQPTYADGTTRMTWEQLMDYARYPWEKNPTPREYRQPETFTQQAAAMQASFQEQAQRIDAERCTLEFATASRKRIDNGRKPIEDSPLFGGERQESLF